jgi:tetratricopeptide (TPR) repeat protein
MRSSRKPLLALAFVGTLIALPALAQQSATSYPAACEASKVSKSDVERAHTVFLSGKQYLEESNYDKAISYFKDAYSIDCSIHAILPIIATAYERKGDRAEAVHALEEYQRRAPNASDHEIIERRIRNLKDQIAREQPPAPTSTATAAPTATATAMPTAPPEPTSTATSAPTSSSVGETPPPSGGGPGVGPWVVVGIGGAAVVGGIVMYAVGAGDVSSASNACGAARKCTSASAASQGNTGRTLENVGAVVGSVGVAAVALGLVWHFVAKPSAAPAAATTLVTPVVAPGYGGLALGGAF